VSVHGSYLKVLGNTSDFAEGKKGH